jgi:hypothetical protein
MKMVPIQHGRKRPPWKSSLYDSGFDLNSDLVLSVLGVEMRREMVAVVHSNNDPKESADFWHSTSEKFATSAEYPDGSNIP